MPRWAAVFGMEGHKICSRDLNQCDVGFSPGDVDIAVLSKCNPCLSNPCMNHGICHNDPVEIYRCSCPPGFKVRATAFQQASISSTIFCWWHIFLIRVRTASQAWMPASVTHAPMGEPVECMRIMRDNTGERKKPVSYHHTKNREPVVPWCVLRFV